MRYNEKYNDELFQIGEVSKILGVSRKAILGFEDMGLLTPAVKDAENGDRYYSADNMTQNPDVLDLMCCIPVDNSFETTGLFRSIYLEGPPNRRENSEDYITQVAVSIKV